MAYRKRLAEDDLNAMGQKISVSLLTLLQTFTPCTVGLFYPTQGEPNVLNLVDQPALSGFSWALPVCAESPAGPLLQFASFSGGDLLEAGRYNIPVPANKIWVQPQVLLIPCVAFHSAGARLGYGAGWYDRTLAQLATKPVAIGLAYGATESVDDFAEDHDQLLDFVVTEHSIVACQGQFNQ